MPRTKHFSYLLYAAVFLTGAIVMILEITGARIIAPFVGGSLIAWTSLIGVILTFLSVGYVLGGKLADTNPSYKFLAILYFLISISILIIPVADNAILSAVAANSSSIKTNSLVGCIALFAIPSLLLGIAAPYLIRLKLTNIKNSGETVGLLYALSTLGSIFGTFFAGFFLFATIGSSQILFLLSGLSVLISLSFALVAKNKNRISLAILAFIAIVIISNNYQSSKQNSLTYETNYSRVNLVKTNSFGREVLILMSGNLPMSGMFLNNNELLFDYTKYYRLISHINKSPNNVLMIGGGGYSYPKDFLRTYPDSQMDVVELDPKYTEIAYEHFSLPKSERLNIFHEDARIFVNSSSKKYDAIMIDAFASSTAVPFQLTTKEFFNKLDNILTDSGIIIMNTISSVEGPSGKFLRAEYNTIKLIFPYVYVFPVSNSKAGESVQNVMIVALRNPLGLTSSDAEMQNYLSHLWTKKIDFDTPILTDDFAPIEQYEIESFK